MSRGNHRNGEIELITDRSTAERLILNHLKPLGVIYEDVYIRLNKDPVIFQNGKPGTYLRLESAKKSKEGQAGSAVLCIVNNRILLLNIFRHATRSRSLEIPRGFAEHETDFQTAVREVSEETGFTTDVIHHLGYIHPDTGITSNRVAVFIATIHVSNTVGSDPIESHAHRGFYTFNEVKSLIAEGRITDAFTLSALTLALVKGYL